MSSEAPAREGGTHTKNVKETLHEVQSIIDLAYARFEATAEKYRARAQRPIDQATRRKYVDVVWPMPSKVGPAEREEKVEPVAERIHAKVGELFEAGRGAELVGLRGTWWGRLQRRERVPRPRAGDR